MREQEELYRFSAGRRGVNLVNIYERKDTSTLYIEWWLRQPDGRRRRYQRALRTPEGDPVTIKEKDVAEQLAVELSQKLEERHQQANYIAVFGHPKERKYKTLGDLLAALHADREESWSRQYRIDQQRYREFWLSRLGADTRLHDIRAPIARQAIKDEVARRKAVSEEGKKVRTWGQRQQQALVRYLKDAYTYAWKQLKWVDEGHNLSELELPKAKPEHKPAFSVDEMKALVKALKGISPKAEWLARVLWQTGRRVSAARTLPKAAVEALDAEAFVIYWPAETDKPRREGMSVVYGRAAELTAGFMAARRGAYVLGTRPPTMDECQAWMTKGIEVAGITPRPRLGWHAIKRRYADRTKGMVGRAAQAGTREDTLAGVYDPRDDMQAMRAIAQKLEAQLEEDA